MGSEQTLEGVDMFFQFDSSNFECLFSVTSIHIVSSISLHFFL